MRRTLLLVTPLLAAALAAGCSPSAGTVTLKLTDAPGDFRRAVVTIDRVYLQGQTDEGDGRGGGREAAGRGRVVLLDTPRTVSLLDLANSTVDLVADAEVPAGTYRELRFVLSGGYVEVEQADGSTRLYASSPSYAGLPPGARVDGTLHMPSAGASGLKVKLEEALEVAGEQHVVLVDFDVSQSFGQEAGASGRWVMRPVIRGGELTASGSVRVTLARREGLTLPTVDGEPLTLGDLHAVLRKPITRVDGTSGVATERLPLTDVDGDGVFEAHFQFLFPGDFTLSFEAPEGVRSLRTDPETPRALTVASGQTQTHTFTLTGVE